MGLLNFFRKKKDWKIDEKTTELFGDERYDEVISTVLPFIMNGQKISLEIKQKAALSYYYKKDYEKALTLFEEIASEKTDVESLFNVLTSLMPLGKMRQAREIFAKILETHKELDANQPRELGIPFIRYYYACGLRDAGLFDDALEQLEELKKIYIELEITDDTFVYIRGVPFLSQTLDLAKDVFDGLGADFLNSDFFKELKSKVDGDGKRLIEQYSGK
jgi:tetratricopeptide (TPR) repeat protein